MPKQRLALPLLAVVLMLAAACGGSDDKPRASSNAPTTPSTASSTSASSTSPSVPPTSPSSQHSAAAPVGSCSYPSDHNAPARPAKAPPSSPVVTVPTRVVIATNRGPIAVTLDADKAPCTVNSFLSLARQGYFDGSSCHRLLDAGDFILQCGDPTGSGAGTPGYSFADELAKDDPRLQPCQVMKTSLGKQDICTYHEGVVAMANAGADTNGSQFFIAYRDSPFPNAYTVFGQTDAAGLTVVRDVAKGGISNQSLAQGDGPPQKKLTITSVKVQ